jgi:uroporphyrin-III C-methyltransferase
MAGKVYIVGAGPGDPELITLKALNVIRKADVILYDRLASKQLLKYARDDCELIYVGKARGEHTYTQDEINRLLLEKALEGKVVVRLKGGDPYVYGRGEEECMYLISNGIDCEVIPGVSSILAAPLYAGIPPTNRKLSSSFAVVTGQEAAEKRNRRVNIKAIASSVDSLIIVMGAKRFKEIMNELLDVLPPDTKIAVVVNGTTDNQYTLTTTLGRSMEIADKVKPPAIIIVGEVVELRKMLWAADRES